MGLSVVTPADEEPISLEEAKQHLRQDLDDDDVMLAVAYLPAAREACENYLSRALITQTLRQTFACWPECMRLERAPHQSVTSIQYVDVDGATQTLASTEYQVDLSSDAPARIMPAYGKVWPSVRTETFNPIIVTFVAGYGAAGSAVPGPIRSAMLLLISHLYENRGAVNIGNINEIPMSVKFLLDPYRVLYA